MCVFVRRHKYTATEKFWGLDYCFGSFFLLKCGTIRSCDIEEKERKPETLENVDKQVTEQARFTSLPWPQRFPRLVYISRILEDSWTVATS